MRKKLKDLNVGDVVGVKEPDGTAKVIVKERSRLFHAAGGCWHFDLKVLTGPNAGEKIVDQHHPGDDEIEVLEEAHGG